MKLSTQIKPIAYLKRHAAEIKSFEESKETWSLLKILDSGHKQIDGGHFRNAEDVFTDLE